MMALFRGSQRFEQRRCWRSASGVPRSYVVNDMEIRSGKLPVNCREGRLQCYRSRLQKAVMDLTGPVRAGDHSTRKRAGKARNERVVVEDDGTISNRTDGRCTIFLRTPG